MEQHPRWLTIPPIGDQANVAVLGLLNTTTAQKVDKQEMQNTKLTKQHDHMIKKDCITKNRVRNLHESTIKMLLFVSAMDNNQSQSTSQNHASTSSTAEQPHLPSKS
jgi:hypothetical protein